MPLNLLPKDDEEGESNSKDSDCHGRNCQATWSVVVVVRWRSHHHARRHIAHVMRLHHCSHQKEIHPQDHGHHIDWTHSCLDTMIPPIKMRRNLYIDCLGLSMSRSQTGKAMSFCCVTCYTYTQYDVIIYVKTMSMSTFRLKRGRLVLCVCTD